MLSITLRIRARRTLPDQDKRSWQEHRPRCRYMPTGQADPEVGIVQHHRGSTQLARQPLSLAKYAVSNGVAKLPDRMPKAVKMPVSERNARRSAHLWPQRLEIGRNWAANRIFSEQFLLH